MSDLTSAGFSADTEVLTRGGWVPVPLVTYLDEVATRSPDGRFEWHHPEHLSSRQRDGEMVHLHSRNTDLLVTPETSILFMHRQRSRRNGVNIELPYLERARPAGALLGQRLSLVATSRWEPAVAAESVAFHAARAQTYGGRLANRGKDFTASATDFAAFMGMYLAEGNLSAPSLPGYYVWIWQKPLGRGYAEYQDLLNRLLGREIRQVAKGGWHFSNKALWTFLSTCGKYAWTKQIPADVLDLSADALEQFWRFYCLGDGTDMVAPGRKPLDVVSTTSCEMAGALQEILQKLGGWAMIQVVDFAKYQGAQRFKSVHPCYRLVRRAGTVAFATEIERSAYKGTVGLIAAGTHAIYVRRNYRPVWAGGIAA